MLPKVISSDTCGKCDDPKPLTLDKHDEENAIEKRNKMDGRLFPEVELYCEGFPKPLLRGVLHLFCTAVLPFGLLNLVRESNGSLVSFFSCLFYVTCNIICYGSSAVYHVGRWSVQVEIFLQKLGTNGLILIRHKTLLL